MGTTMTDIGFVVLRFRILVVLFCRLHDVKMVS